MKLIFKILAVMNLLLIITAFFIFQKNKTSIRVVRTGVVLQRYKGMQDSQALITQKENAESAKIDSLQVRYNQAVNFLEKNEKKFNKSEIEQNKEKIERYKEEAIRYQQIAKKRMKKESDKITQGTLNQVNDYIARYAAAHKIKIVTGVTLTGNVLYCDPSLDITDEIIKGLNSSYKK